MEDGFLIILEGPDRTGKSTIATRIQERTTAAVRHAGLPTRTPIEEYVMSIEHRTYFQDVFDRWHVGQYVYPRVYPKGRKPMSAEEFLWIDLFLKSRGAVLVNTWDQPWKITARVRDDKKSYLQEEDVERTLKLFYKAMQHTILPVTKAKLDEFDLNGTIQWARNNYARHTRFLDEFPRVIGNTYNPAILLVGDQLNIVKSKQNFTSPFAPYPTSSGRYLMEALLHGTSRVWLNKIAIVNSKDEDLYWIHRVLGQPRVVALGREASSRLTSARVKHGIVPHPQYTRRFFSQSYQLYGRDIILAAAAESDEMDSWRVNGNTD